MECHRAPRALSVGEKSVDWDDLIDDRGFASLLSEGYAHYAIPVKEGLSVFLAGLPEEVQREILTQQAALSLKTTASERLGQLARSCPVLHKLGQILARNHRLSPALRACLQPLESLPPTISIEAIRQILEKELGPLERQGIALGSSPLAEASVAVVAPFEFQGSPSCSHGVFKVLKPGIEERLELELGLLGRVAAHLDDRCHELKIPHVDYRESFRQVSEKLAWEVRLDEEQRHLTTAKQFYSNDSKVQIPAVLEQCTPRVTAMERVFGYKVTDHALNCPSEKRRLARLVAQALISRPIFSKCAKSLFHCDPHAGNLLHTTDGRLAILDWSLVGWLTDEQRIALTQIALSALTLNDEGITMGLEGLANRRGIDRCALQATVRSWLNRLRHGHLLGYSWLVGLLDDAVQRAKLRVAANMMLFRKSLLTLEDVIAELAGVDSQIDDVLAVDFIGHFVSEFPERWFKSLHSRDYATRVSTTELMEAVLSWPITAARFWREPAPPSPGGESMEIGGQRFGKIVDR